MTETTQKPQAEIIVIPRARLAFARIHKAEQSRGPDGQPRGTAKFSCTLLIDPTRKDVGQITDVEGKVLREGPPIQLIKEEAAKVVTAKWGERASWPKANPATGMGGLILCFGNGNDLPKVYDGYKDMFYVKLSDTSRPLLGNRARGIVVEGDPQCPYSGCIVRARISPWVYFPTAKRPQSANGVNFNFRSLQFVEDGQGFGGGGSRSAEEEFEQMAGDSAPADDDIPF